MALSDSCSDTIYQLSSEIVNYADWGYQPSQISHIFDALYNLSLFVVEQDNRLSLPKNELRVIAGRIFLYNLLSIESDDLDALILKLLADVSKVNNNFSVILDEVYSDAIQSTNELKEDFNEFSLKLKEIIRLRDDKTN